MPIASEPSLRFAFLWPLTLCLLLMLLPVALLNEWPWQLGRRDLLAFALLVGGFLAASGLHIYAQRRDLLWRWLATFASGSVFAFLLLLLIASKSTSSRMVAVATFAIAVLLLPVPYLFSRLRAAAVAVALIALAGALALAIRHHTRAGRPVEQQKLQLSVGTNLYNLELTTYAGYVRKPAVRGGGFTEFADRVLLATGDGSLYLIDSRPDALTVQPLSVRVPLNGEEFATAAGGKYAEPLKSSQYGAGAPPGVQTWRFRTADIAARRRGDHVQLFASHHYWHDDQQCFVLRVSTIELTAEGAQIQGPPGQWRTLFETKPCLPIKGPDAKRGKNPFQGEEIGGRLWLTDDHTLLLTVGDMSFSGVESWQIFAQDPEASYGKTLTIDTETGLGSVHTLGHRNPQGLMRDSRGDLWLTEHGPKGGDEVNLLQAGVNYGWPRVTYGTDYLTFAWPLNAQQGRHEGFQEPAYAFVPSIGVSQIIEIRQDLFEGWKNDFLVGSLSTRALYRLRMKDRRVVFAEPIPLNYRVRDMFELPDGRILVWTDTATLIDIHPTHRMNGELLFGSMCQSCHWIHDGLSHRAGPDLFGIVDKDVASGPNFDYSPALRSFGGEWTAERLDRFLADPQALVPGNAMAFEGIQDPEQRRLLIEHLRNAIGQ